MMNKNKIIKKLEDDLAWNKAHVQEILKEKESIGCMLKDEREYVRTLNTRILECQKQMCVIQDENRELKEELQIVKNTRDTYKNMYFKILLKTIYK